MLEITYGEFLNPKNSHFNSWYLYALIGLLFLIIGYITIFILADYSKNWIHSELPALSYSKVLRHGSYPSPRDLHLMFDMHSFNYAPRPRLLSHLQEILNIKFRMFLFNLIPPHPSLSLSWVWLVILAPICLYRFLKSTYNNLHTSLIGLIVYFSSTSVLSGMTMMFRPAKVLAIAFSLIAFGMISNIKYKKELVNDSTGWIPKKFSQLLLIIFAGFLSDETFVVTYLLLPLLFPEIIGLWPLQYKRLLAYSCVFFLFFISATIIIPYASLKLGYASKFENILTVMTSKSGDPTYSLATRVKQFNLQNIGSGLKQYTQYQLTPSSFFTDHGSPILQSSNYFFVGFFLFFVALIFSSDTKRPFLLRWLFVTILATIITSFIGGGDTYYYGSIMIVFIAPLFAFLLSASGNKLVKIINLFALIAISIFSLSNFEKANNEQIYRQIPMYHQYFPKELASMKGPDLTFTTAFNAWKKRNDSNYLELIRNNYSPMSYSMFYEFERMRK